MKIYYIASALYFQWSIDSLKRLKTNKQPKHKLVWKGKVQKGTSFPQKLLITEKMLR